MLKSDIASSDVYKYASSLQGSDMNSDYSNSSVNPLSCQARKRYEFRDRTSDIFNITPDSQNNENNKPPISKKAQDYHFSSPFGCDYVIQQPKVQSSYNATYGNSNAGEYTLLNPPNTEMAASDRNTSRKVSASSQRSYGNRSRISSYSRGGPSQQNQENGDGVSDNIFVTREDLQTPEERQNAMMKRQQLDQLLNTNNSDTTAYSNYARNGRNMNGTNGTAYHFSAPFATSCDGSPYGNPYTKKSNSGMIQQQQQQQQQIDMDDASSTMNNYSGTRFAKSPVMDNNNPTATSKDINDGYMNAGLSQVHDDDDDSKYQHEKSRFDELYKDLVESGKVDPSILDSITSENLPLPQEDQIKENKYAEQQQQQQSQQQPSQPPQHQQTLQHYQSQANNINNNRLNSKNHNYSNIFGLGPETEEDLSHYRNSAKPSSSSNHSGQHPLFPNTHSHIFGNGEAGEDDPTNPPPKPSSRRHSQAGIYGLSSDLISAGQNDPMTSTYNSMNAKAYQPSANSGEADINHVHGLSSTMLHREFQCKSRRYNPKTTSQILF